MDTQSAAAWFKAANGKRVKKTVAGAPTLAEWHAKQWVVLDSIKAEGGTNITLDGNEFHYTTAVGWPGLRAGPTPELSETFGTLSVKSKEYAFTVDGGSPCYGDKRAAVVMGGALVKDYGGGRVIRFYIVGEA